MFWEGDPNTEINMNAFDSTRITMRLISKTVAKDIIIKYHYSHNWPAVQLTLGFYIDDKLNGVVCFGQSAGSRMINSLPTPKYWELQRLFSFDWAGKNMESYMISQSIKYIKRNHKEIEILVSFADPEQNHSGIIYQASNWLFTGITDQTGTPRYFIRGKWYHPRSLGAKYGTGSHSEILKMFPDVEFKKTVRKYRYLYFVCSKKLKKKLLKKLKYEILPYPKNII